MRSVAAKFSLERRSPDACCSSADGLRYGSRSVGRLVQRGSEYILGPEAELASECRGLLGPRVQGSDVFELASSAVFVRLLYGVITTLISCLPDDEPLASSSRATGLLRLKGLSDPW